MYRDLLKVDLSLCQMRSNKRFVSLVSRVYHLWFEETEGQVESMFPINILGNSLCPADSVKNLGVWFDSDFSLSKHVQNVCKSCFVKLHDFRHVRQFLTLMMFLCLWLMLWLVVGWIIATHFSGASPSSIYANYSASKIVQLELYQTTVDTPV